MQPHVMILLEGTLSFGAPLGFAVVELIRLNRKPPPPPRDRTQPPPLPPSPPASANPRQVVLVRELEDA